MSRAGWRWFRGVRADECGRSVPTCRDFCLIKQAEVVSGLSSDRAQQDIGKESGRGAERNDAMERFMSRRSVWRHIYDFLGAPLRMVLLPDHVSRMLKLTSLQDERIGAVLGRIRGRLLDIGAGDNLLVRIYGNGVGIDVYDFGGGATIVDDTSRLPYADGSFDTVTFLACLNHIPNREAVVREAFRLLKPGGRIIATMISPFLGKIGHTLWWYSEEKKRGAAEGEIAGISRGDMIRLLAEAGFVRIEVSTFLYGMNHLYHGFRDGAS